MGMPLTTEHTKYTEEKQQAFSVYSVVPKKCKKQGGWVKEYENNQH